MNYKKVLKTNIVAICQCGHVFDVEQRMHESENNKGNGHIPFSASSSNTTMYCPECLTHEGFRLSYVYKNLYRRRCPRCDEMFETPKSWQEKCDNCIKEHVETMAHMGPG